MSTNVGARTWELLRQQAKRSGADVQSLATSYAIERFMARLSSLDPRGNITVKGGQSLGILFGNQMRPTKDLDINIGLDGIGDPETWAHQAIIEASSLEAEDGVAINVDELKVEFRDHQGDGGLRITVPASIHTCRTPFMIDVGIGNEITFDPTKIKIPGVLAGHKSAPPASEIRIYPHENTLAEKLVSKIEDGIASIRHKDFFDIWLLVEIMRRAGDLRILVDNKDEETALASEIKTRLADGTFLEMGTATISDDCIDRLGLALVKTSEHRNTDLPENITSFLTDEFGYDSMQNNQWFNWCRNQKSRLLYQPPGTAKSENKEVSLMTLFSHISPELDAISERANTYKNISSSTMKI